MGEQPISGLLCHVPGRSAADVVERADALGLGQLVRQMPDRHRVEDGWNCASCVKLMFAPSTRIYITVSSVLVAGTIKA